MKDIDKLIEKIEKGDSWDDNDEVVEIKAKKPLDKVIPIRLSSDKWNKMRKEAEKLGVGPTTLARMWILEQLEENPEEGVQNQVEDIAGTEEFKLLLSKSLFLKASTAAKREGMDLNQFILLSMAETIGSYNMYENMASRLERYVNQSSIGRTYRIFSDYAFQENANNLVPTQIPYIGNMSPLEKSVEVPINA
jgi:hypothetical protein